MPAIPLLLKKWQEWQRVENRIGKVCETACKNDIMVLVDAEESWIQKPVDDLTDAMMEKYKSAKRPLCSIPFSFYRHDRLVFLKRSYDMAVAKS